MMGKVEHWVNQWGSIRITEQNPCGCHHLDVLVQWGNKYGESCTYSFNDDLCVELFLENRFIELGEL